MESRIILSLNEQQLQAVNHRGAPLRIIAGAGTGKTATLTRRFVSIVENDEASVGQVLALTFTRKAASEMKARIVEQLDRSYTEFWVETFHSFCSRVLRLESSMRGEPAPVVLDGQARLKLLREAIAGEVFPAYGSRADDLERQALTFIDRAKDELLDVEHAYALAEQRNSVQYRDLARAYDLYQRHLSRQRRVFDWGELQTRLIDLLQDEQVRERWAGKFRHILVDEFQDVNEAQCRLIELLAGDGRNLTVVGDVDQSIYAFRGASHQILTDFEQRFPGAQTIYLTSNFRSHQAILDTGNALISRNPDHHQRQPLTAFDARSGAIPTIVKAQTEQEEADAIARQVARLHFIEGVALSDIAVLLRSVQTAAGPIESALAAYGLRSTFADDINRTSDAAADVLAVLRLVDGDDDGDTIHLLTCQGIDPLQVLSAEIEPLDTGASLVERLTALDPAAGKVAGQALHKARQLVDRPLPEQVYDAAVLCCRLPLGESISRNDVRYVQNLRGLLERATEIAEAGGSREDFIAELCAAPPPRNDQEHDGNSVQIMTVHGAKGLEFRHVFVAGLAQGRFPLRRRLDRGLDLNQPESMHPERALDLQDDASRRQRFMDEERRLGYVALTRAIDFLYLSHARSYAGVGNTHSVFLQDIRAAGDDLLQEITVLSPEDSAWNASELARLQHERIASALDHPVLDSDALAEMMLGQLTLDGLPDTSPWRPRPNPFPHDGSESLTISFSALQTYETCPRKYYYQNVLRLPDESTSAYLIRGNVLHEAIQWINDQRAENGFPTWPEVAGFINDTWPDSGFDSPAQEQQVRLQCEQMLYRFHTYEKQVEREILGTELKINAELGGHRLTGRIDCLARMPDGTIEIIDYKSGSSAPSKNALKSQLGLYQIAYTQRNPDAEPRAVLFMLQNENDKGGRYTSEFDPDNQVRKVDFDPNNLDDVAESVHFTAGRILRNEFPALGSARDCGRCAYRYVCDGGSAGE